MGLPYWSAKVVEPRGSKDLDEKLPSRVLEGISWWRGSRVDGWATSRARLC